MLSQFLNASETHSKYPSQKVASSKSTTTRSRKFWILCAIAVVTFLFLVVVTPVAVHKKKQNACVAGKNDLRKKDEKYLKNARLQFHFEGFNEDFNVFSSSSSSAADKEIIQSALRDSYNKVSGGCNDIYERWMYDAKLVELTTVHDYMTDDDSTTTTIAHVDTKISCINDCPDDEIFASAYPTVDWPTYRNRARFLQDGSNAGGGPTSINAGQVLIAMEDTLVLDGVISGISVASFESVNHGVVKRFGKKSKKSKKNSCYVGKGKGKGGSKTSSPSVSLQPSVSPEPSGAPSVSLEPTRGKGGKGASKTAAPSVSSEPSLSFAPSCSLMPSQSEQPSPGPSQSEAPSEQPSEQPSARPTITS